MVQAFVSIDVERGAFRRGIEERFARVKAEPAEDGRPIVLDECLESAQEIGFTLTGGAQARIRYLTHRPRVTGDSTNRGALLWLVLPDAPTYVYRVTPRRRPNTPLHLTLGDPQQHEQKLCHLNQLRAASLFLFGMGPGYSGLFNASAPGRSELFHFQFFGVPLPIWEGLEGGRVSVRDQHSYSGEASVGWLHGWAFRAPVFESKNPDALAGLLWSHDQGLRDGDADDTDLLLNHGRDGLLRAIVVRRRRAHPEEFYPENPEAYGSFGGLELSGLVVAITREDVFRVFEADRNFAAQRFKSALQEVTAWERSV